MNSLTMKFEEAKDRCREYVWQAIYGLISVDEAEEEILAAQASMDQYVTTYVHCRLRGGDEA